MKAGLPSPPRSNKQATAMLTPTDIRRRRRQVYLGRAEMLALYESGRSIAEIAAQTEMEPAKVRDAILNALAYD